MINSSDKLIEPRHEISNNVVCATSKAADQHAQRRSLIRAFASRLNILSVKLLTEQHLKFLSLIGGCTDLSKSTLVKIPHCWKSHVAAQLLSFACFYMYMGLVTRKPDFVVCDQLRCRPACTSMLSDQHLRFL